LKKQDKGLPYFRRQSGDNTQQADCEMPLFTDKIAVFPCHQGVSKYYSIIQLLVMLYHL
jgi:hypothetical protein